MVNKPRKMMQKLYGLLILLGILQIAGVALLIYFSTESFKREQSLLDRTAEMMEIALPGIKHEVGDVSKKASEIKSDISGLRNQVSNLDERVGEVKNGVSAVGLQVEHIDNSVTGFVQDTSGIVWGHSVNPYLLLGVLAILLLSIPVWGYFYSRKGLRHQAETVDTSKRPAEGLSSKLDKLTVVLESIRREQERSQTSGPDIARLLQQTERLLSEAREELAQIDGQKTRLSDQEPERTPEKLH
jgi:uncharacterized protein YoxC